MDDKLAFTISNPPLPSSNRRLATDFLAQQSHSCRPHGNVQKSVKELDLLSTGKYGWDGYDLEDSVAVIYVSTLEVSGTSMKLIAEF